MSAVGEAIAGVGLVISTYYTRKKIKNSRKSQDKLDIKAEVDEEMAKAKELSDLQSDLRVLRTDIGWIKAQLGKSPNSGGAMEQMLTFVNTATKEFAEIKAWNLRHMEIHLENKEG